MSLENLIIDLIKGFDLTHRFRDKTQTDIKVYITSIPESEIFKWNIAQLVTMTLLG